MGAEDGVITERGGRRGGNMDLKFTQDLIRVIVESHSHDRILDQEAPCK